MKEHQGLESVEPEIDGVVSVGTFDGVHLGHQRLIARVKELAVEIGGASTIVTFEPHPQTVVRRKERPPIRILTSLAEKRDILSSLGIERLIVIPFTPEFAATGAASFVERILVSRLGCRAVVVGSNHGFGFSRSGTVATLRELGNRFGFLVQEVPPVVVGGAPISSTRIRKLLALDGDVNQAAALLGRLYEVRGTVTRGEGRGRKLGFPTANLVPDSSDKLLPKDGIYAGFAQLEGERLKSLINVGVRPTFNGRHRVVEAHVLAQLDELYGAPIRLQFVERVRDERAYPSPEALVRRMERDREESLHILETFSGPTVLQED